MKLTEKQIYRMRRDALDAIQHAPSWGIVTIRSRMKKSAADVEVLTREVMRLQSHMDHIAQIAKMP